MPDPIDIPGISELWTHTTGDPRITIAVIDGRVDLERACFRGADLTVARPYWQGDDESKIDPRYRAEYRKILDEDDERFAAYKRSGRPIREAVAEREAALAARIPPDALFQLDLQFHATHISSIIFGQHGSPVTGIAPRCRGINISLAVSQEEIQSPLVLTRALDLAIELGASIVHVTVSPPTRTGQTHDMLARAVRQCCAGNILVVAPAGNDEGENWVVPAILPGVLAVGALKDSGEPFRFSNWGGPLQEQGVLAPGDEILGAQLGTDEPVRKKGTSCAAPIVSGLCALLLDVQRRHGLAPDPQAVRAAVLATATPCDPAQVPERARCLAGKLNIPGAFQRLTGQVLRARGARPASGNGPASKGTRPGSEPDPVPPPPRVTPSGVAARVQPAAELPPRYGSLNLVYAIGVLGYDFGTEPRRDSFAKLMSADPGDARRMVDYLADAPVEARSLIWTLEQESTPIYAIEPTGPFAAEVYRVLLSLLAGQVEAETPELRIERMSLPGRLTRRSIELLSGLWVPVVELEAVRGLHGWHVNRLVDAAVESAPAPQRAAVRRSLGAFLQRIYHDLRSPGRTSRDRALNHAGTNVFQAARGFMQAADAGLELDRIDLEKSAFGRVESDCWDVRLTFFDPENCHRARRVFRFTIDVSDIIPVTVGDARSWSAPAEIGSS